MLVILGVLGFYLSQSEWCHCQRDGWMLLPVFGALTLRRRMLPELAKANGSTGKVYCLALAEGLVWGLAVWLKPHVLIPALCVWLVTVGYARPGKRVLADVLGLLTGGLLVGAAGIVWMIRHECWLPFWETVREWNPHYFAAGREHWTLPRFLAASWRLSPWMLLHVPALVIAFQSIALAIRSRDSDSDALSPALIAACYLGLTGQAFFLQHLFDYVHIAPLVLAILVTAFWVHRQWAAPWCRAMAVGFAMLAIAMSPLADAKRAGLWRTALTTPANAFLYDELKTFDNPNWDDMDQVAEFLAGQSPGKKDVCCFNSDLAPLYNQLNLMPPTRIVYVQEILVYFPDRREAILKDLQTTPHRYVVTDIVSARLTAGQIERLLSPEFQASLKEPSTKRRPYPWGYPVVFRAGNYLVHEVH
jgi:hypothetical protein